MSDDYVSVIDLKPFMKNLNILLIILSRLEEHEQTNENFLLFHAADATGSVYLSCPYEIGKHLKFADIVRIKGGYCATVKGSLQLNAGRTGAIKRVGEYFLAFSEKPNISTLELDKPSE